MVVNRATGWAAAGLLLALAAGAGLYQRTARENAATQVAAGAAVSAVDPVLKALAAGKPAVIEFGANACQSCREMKPVLAALARSHGDHITVADVDILREREYISRFQIRLMPTQIFFDAQGHEIGRHMGKISGDEILARLGLPAAQP